VSQHIVRVYEEIADFFAVGPEPTEILSFGCPMTLTNGYVKVRAPFIPR